ncbi:MAG: thioredoxin [Proteobacteria bacterium]|nr:thioredoxin [Pseudomonadota bacterium]MDA1057898.1 thioredoxin [Pseudomonadota bacterium]
MVETLIGGGPPAPDLIKDSNSQNFMADVIDASQEVPVIVDFWAPWCGPCKQLGPMIEKVVKSAQGKVKLVKINIDDSPEIAQQLRIQSIPAVFAFDKGQPVDAFVGAQPESQIKAFVERLAGGIGPSPVDEALEAAQTALDDGETAAAANIYGQILQAEPGNPVAIGGLVRCYVLAKDLDHARQTLALVPKEHEDHAAIAAARSALALADQASVAGDPTELRAQVEANPGDHQARFDLATALIGNGDSEGAIDQLLEIMKKGAQWNDGAAKDQLLKIFEALGPVHDATKSGRRRLSALLFS